MLSQCRSVTGGGCFLRKCLLRVHTRLRFNRYYPVLVLAACVAAAPSITPGGIANASGYQTTLAPGVVFVIFGNNLGPGAIQGATPPDYPATLARPSISFTPAGGGTPVNAKRFSRARAWSPDFCRRRLRRAHTPSSVTYNSEKERIRIRSGEHSDPRGCADIHNHAGHIGILRSAGEPGIIHNSGGGACLSAVDRDMAD